MPSSSCLCPHWGRTALLENLWSSVRLQARQSVARDKNPEVSNMEKSKMSRYRGGGQLGLTPVAVLINVKLTKSDFLLMSHKVDTPKPENRLYVRVAKISSMLDCPFVVGGARFSTNGLLGIQARKSNFRRRTAAINTSATDLERYNFLQQNQ